MFSIDYFGLVPFFFSFIFTPCNYTSYSHICNYRYIYISLYLSIIFLSFDLYLSIFLYLITSSQEIVNISFTVSFLVTYGDNFSNGNHSTREMESNTTTLKHTTQNIYKQCEVQFLAGGIINSKPSWRTSYLILESYTKLL